MAPSAIRGLEEEDIPKVVQPIYPNSEVEV